MQSQAEASAASLKIQKLEEKEATLQLELKALEASLDKAKDEIRKKV